MSELTNRNKLTPLLFLAPVIWMTTGMLWDGDGDMRLVPIALAIAFISIYLFRFDVIKDNFRNSFWIKLLLINGLFGAVAYGVYGFDSRELRATLSVLVLLLVTPRYLHTKQAMQWLLFLVSFFVLLYAFYFQFVVGANRSYWPINAVPFAAICGLICVVSLGLLLSNFKSKQASVLFISTILSLFSLVISQSRGPMFSAIFVIILLLLYVSLRKSRTLVIGGAVIITALLYGVTQISIVQERIEDTILEYNAIQKDNYDSSLGIRLKMFDIAYELWSEKPLVGYGKDIKSEFDRLELDGVIEHKFNTLISMTFHNGYLDKFVLYGILGGVIFLVLLIYPIWKARYYCIGDGSVLLWAPALFIVICNFSDAPFINAQAAIYYMFIIGSVTMMLSNEKEVE